jgi:hypothetical protein
MADQPIWWFDRGKHDCRIKSPFLRDNRVGCEECQEQPMEPSTIDVASLVDANMLLATGEFPYTFLAFPPSCVDQDGLPTDAAAREYIAVVQSLGVKVGIWVNTPTSDAYAFVGPEDIDKLQKVLDTLEKSGRFPKGYAERLCTRLLGVADSS